MVCLGTNHEHLGVRIGLTVLAINDTLGLLTHLAYGTMFPTLDL